MSKVPKTRRADRGHADDQKNVATSSQKGDDDKVDFNVVDAGIEIALTTDGPGVTQRYGAPELQKSTYDYDFPSSSTDDTVHESYTYVEFLYTIVSLCSYIFDVGTDVYVAIIYYNDDDWWWFVLTVTFIVVPSLTITAFSLAWYFQDKGTPLMANPLHWVPRVLLVFLQLGPLLRYIDTMIFGCRSKRETKKTRQQYWYKLKTYEETDSALLRLLECFMESAPQLVLQLYIICVQGIKQDLALGIGQIISCVTSLCSVAWALAAYQKALRQSLDNKAKLGYGPMVVMFAWRILTIGSRVLALAVFASCFSYWMFVVVGLHWSIMLIWICYQNTHFCVTKFEEFVFNVVAAFICIFDLLNLIEGHTRLRYLVYYFLVYGENVTMVVLWYSVKSTTGKWYILPVMVCVCGLFIVGVLLQIVYYMCCHPNNRPPYRNEKRIRLCVPCSQLV